MKRTIALQMIFIVGSTAAQSASPFVSEDVLKALHEQKAVRVVVETDSQQGAQQSAQAHISRLLAGSAAVAPLDDRAVLLKISSSTLARLRSDHRVRSIYRDVPAFPTLT